MGKILRYFVMPHPPIMIPEIGKGEDEKISATRNACMKIANEIADLKPDAVILITPHGPVFRDAVAVSDVPEISGDFRNFGVPQLKFNMNVNMQLTEAIIRNADDYNIPVAPITQKSIREYNVLCELDHGALIPLYHINKVFTDFQIVHITYGFLPPVELYRFGMVIKKAVEEEEFNVVLIASGDLSHRLSEDGPYGYNSCGPEFDRQVTKFLKDVDVPGIFDLDKKLVEGAGECGLRSFYMLLGAMDGLSAKGELLSYEGPFGVGYGVLRMEPGNSTQTSFLDQIEQQKKRQITEHKLSEGPYVSLARKSLENYLKIGKRMTVPDDLPEEMLNTKKGVFVSIKKEGELRGCIGTIFPATDNIAQEIIRNAIEAGERDPRFYPVEEEELDDLVFSVDVLETPTAAVKQELDPQRFGIIVRSKGKAGLLLPNLEGVDTATEQLDIALKKGGIGTDENYTIEKFEVIRHR